MDGVARGVEEGVQVCGWFCFWEGGSRIKAVVGDKGSPY